MALRLLGITFLRTKNHEQILLRNRELREANEALAQDNSSYRRTVTQHEQTIDALKDKCSKVNVSRLENELSNANLKVKLQANIIRRIDEEKNMSGDVLQNGDREPDGVLCAPLVQSAAADAPSDPVVVQDEIKGL